MAVERQRREPTLDSFEEETFLYLDNQSEQNGRMADHPNHENDLPNL
jgi:hypothetical protein